MADISKLINDINSEEARNADFLHLTANENQLSNLANKLLASKLSERYYFGGGTGGIVDFGSYTFLGLPAVENLVLNASDALKKMTGAAVVNISCFSGLHAMMCAIMGVTKHGETILSLRFL